MSCRLIVLLCVHLQVPELKRKVAALGLEAKGTKAELLARVEKYLQEQEGEGERKERSITELSVHMSFTFRGRRGTLGRGGGGGGGGIDRG